MSCLLLPQLICLQDTFAVINFKTYHNQLYNLNNRETISSRVQCSLCRTSPTTTKTAVFDVEKVELPGEKSWKLPMAATAVALLDIEKLKIPPLETYSNSIAANTQWRYTGGIAPPVQTKIEATLAKETLLTSEEAGIVAAAAEAVALAKAALKVAEDAAMRVSNSKGSDLILAKNNVAERHLADISRLGESKFAETNLQGGPRYEHPPFVGSVNAEPTREELELVQALESSIAVRSRRQVERKARRARAAEKEAANVVLVKSGSTSRRKHSTQDIDSSDPLRFLKGSTTSSRILTAAEERKLSEGIQDLLKLERLQEELAQRCGSQPTFAQWAAVAGVDQKTLRGRLNYGSICKDKMIKSNIRLVISIARNYLGAGMNLEDLVQEGCRGLVRGAEKFDASKGFKFSTYAHWWIKQAVRRSLSDQSRTIRLPFHMVEATYRVKEARKHFYTENGRQANDEEIAEATGLSMKRLSAVMLTPKAPRSLDQKIGFDQNLRPSDIIANPEAETSEDLLSKQFMRQDLEKVLDTLNPREKRVIRCRFGLEDGRMKTLQEIGELMGVSRERIRQIESSAFRKLRHKKRSKHLQQYLTTLHHNIQKL